MKNKNIIYAGIIGIQSGKLASPVKEYSQECIALKEQIKQTMILMIEKHGVEGFISGMNPFTEFYAAEIVLDLKKNYSVSLMCVEGYSYQYLFTGSNKNKAERYKTIINKCDCHIVLQEKYDAECNTKQRDYIFCQSNFLIAIQHRHGDIPIALGKKIPVYQIDPYTRKLKYHTTENVH